MKGAYLIILISLGGLANADHVSTGIRFDGWRIETSEDLYVGATHTSYPVQNLVDGKPETAWVYSGNDYHKPTTSSDRLYRNEYQICITPKSPTWMDELRIMNGYNKSLALFQQNSRALEIEIFDTDYPVDLVKNPKTGKYEEVPRKPIRTVQLSDTLGVKSIWLPKRKYNRLMVRFSQIKQGSIDDLCISELQLRAGGEDLIPVPKVFESTMGDDCGCGGNFKLQTMSGKTLGYSNVEDWYDLGFSKDGKYYGGQNENGIWIANIEEEKRIRNYHVPKGYSGHGSWINSNTVNIDLQQRRNTPQGPNWITIKTKRLTLN